MIREPYDYFDDFGDRYGGGYAAPDTYPAGGNGYDPAPAPDPPPTFEEFTTQGKRASDPTVPLRGGVRTPYQPADKRTKSAQPGGTNETTANEGGSDWAKWGLVALGLYLIFGGKK